MLQDLFGAASRHSYTIQATTQRRRLRFLFELFLGGRVPKDPPPHGPMTILNSHPREKGAVFRELAWGPGGNATLSRKRVGYSIIR